MPSVYENWVYMPSCPCRRCEKHRWDNGLSVLYVLGPPDWVFDDHADSV